MTGEIHIGSLLVQCRPDAIESVKEAVDREDGAEVSLADPSGKLVVLIESDDSGRISDLSARLTRVPGVLNCNLVFHASESEAAAREFLQ